MRQDHRRDPFTVIHNPLRSAQLVFKVREAVEGRPTPFAFSHILASPLAPPIFDHPPTFVLPNCEWHPTPKAGIPGQLC
jgi:hypothetical protein